MANDNGSFWIGAWVGLFLVFMIVALLLMGWL
jgi:hypothetical protein